MPIGNLTSQIFANIYLNELDRFVKHELKVKYYLRYGDDFILVDENLERLRVFRDEVVRFIVGRLRLELNPKGDKILKAKQGLRFLGVMIHPPARQLKRRNRNRVKKRLNLKNIGSFYGLIKKHGSRKYNQFFSWFIYDQVDREF